MEHYVLPAADKLWMYGKTWVGVGVGVAPLVQGEEQEHLNQHPREAVFVSSSFIHIVKKSKFIIVYSVIMIIM